MEVLTFDGFMAQSFPGVTLHDHQFTLDAVWLKAFWDLAQISRNGNSGPAGLVQTPQMTRVEKPWGYELWICNNELYCGKLLWIDAGKWLSYHFHKIKDEVLYVFSGNMWFIHNMEGDIKSVKMGPGDAFHVTPGIIHQMHAVEPTMLLEFSTQHFDEDSYRITRDLVANNE